MSDKPEAAEGAAKPAKSKKMLIIVGALVVVLALAAGGGYFFLKKRNAASEDGEEASAKEVAHDTHATPPAYLPMDNMVVNLADPGGERVAQVGVTLQVADAKAVDTVKAFMPTIRSGVLMLISRRTAEELLSPEGKEKLAQDILRETTKPFGGGDEEEHEDTSSTTKKKKKKAEPEYPVRGVLFSSFIVQ